MGLFPYFFQSKSKMKWEANAVKRIRKVHGSLGYTHGDGRGCTGQVCFLCKKRLAATFFPPLPPWVYANPFIPVNHSWKQQRALTGWPWVFESEQNLKLDVWGPFGPGAIEIFFVQGWMCFSPYEWGQRRELFFFKEETGLGNVSSFSGSWGKIH